MKLQIKKQLIDFIKCDLEESDYAKILIRTGVIKYKKRKL